MDLNTVLKEEFTARKKRNPRYSLRAFAKSLGVHSSTLTRILNGKRKPSPSLVDKILKRIEMDPSLKSALLLSLHTSPNDPARLENQYNVLAPADVSSLDGWHYFAMLSAFEIKSFQPKAAWIAKYFGLPREKVESALNKLAALGLIRVQKGKWALTGVATSSRSAPQALRKIHREYIERALHAQARQRPADDITGITMSIPKRKLPEAIRRIKDFRRSLAEYLCIVESADLDEVYRLNIQFFSLKDGS